METVQISTEMDLALSLMEGLRCPRSLTVAILIRHEEWDQLTSLEAVPSHYPTPASFRRAVLATEFLRKFDSFPLKLDLEALAATKWQESERGCFKMNVLLTRFMEGGESPLATEAGAAVLTAIRKNVRDAIGTSPPTTWEGRFGPGATMSDSSRCSTVPDKLSSAPTFTPNALFHLVPWTGTWWATSVASIGRAPVSVRGNAYFTVPKTSRSLRSCAKEPSINGFYQAGLGRVIRQRLRDNVGIDLESGQALHRQVAREASRSGSYATIDLSSASDTVATALVKLLLPEAWYSCLASLRSEFTLFRDRPGVERWVRLEKFSSMGNGYTFELETLLFWAIARAIVPGREGVWVYGDDIIVPTSSAKTVLAALEWFGFTPNPRKTFAEGPFRESCGGDYFEGEPVRAHYLRGVLDEPAKFISLANGIRRSCLQDESGDLWRDCLSTWFRVLDSIPGPIRLCRGPEALGDAVIHDDECRWQCRWRDSIRMIRAYLPVPNPKVRFGGYGYDTQMAVALYGSAFSTHRDNGQVSDSSLLPARGDKTGYRIGWVPFS